jgi:hypothetical protein
MRKYFCDICSQEFKRRWNMGRHMQMMHHYNPAFVHPFQLDSYGTNKFYQSSQFSKTVNPPASEKSATFEQTVELTWKIAVLTELRGLNSSLFAIKSILLAMMSQGSRHS